MEIIWYVGCWKPELDENTKSIIVRAMETKRAAAYFSGAICNAPEEVHWGVYNNVRKVQVSSFRNENISSDLQNDKFRL